MKNPTKKSKPITKKPTASLTRANKELRRKQYMAKMIIDLAKELLEPSNDIR